MRRSTAVPLGRRYLALATLATTAGLTAACQSDPEQQVYCADQNGVVVDEDLCDGSDPNYLFWAGAFGAGLRPGHKLSKGTKIAYGDAAARERYGLPASGKVANGTVVTGGFGGDSDHKSSGS